MPEVNYYLKKANPSTGKCLIYLQFRYFGNKLVYSFKQNVAAEDWNRKKQRLKSNLTTTIDGSYHLNDLLDNLKNECLLLYHTELSQGVPLVETIKKGLDDFLYRNLLKKQEDKKKPTLYSLIQLFIDGHVKYKGKSKSPNTLKKYKTILGQLKEFEERKKIRIDFDTIDLNFLYSWITYLKESKKQKQNSIAKSIKTLKVFMNEGLDLGYTNNVAFKNKKFSVAEEDVESIHLTEQEILRLYQFDLSHNRKLEQVRDLFCFGCCVGLRYSDYSNIQPENIISIDKERFIKIYTQKTGELVIIPCNPLVIQIFEKYVHSKNNLPRSISLVNFNKYIKDACREAGFKEKGRLLSSTETPLYQLISSHTARRSFATNYYLQGFPSIELMRITGHRSEKSFLKYIKVTKQTTAARLSEHIKKNWGHYLMKVS